MKIGINGFEAIIPRFGYDKNGFPNRVGSSEVCFQILNSLEKIDQENEYTIYLPAKPTPDMPRERFGWQYKIIPNKKLWTITGLSVSLLKNEKQDVFFSPSHYGTVFTPFPEVISVLDVSYKYFPELFNKSDLLKLALWGRYSIGKASKIITISESSKGDIIKEYGVKPEKISVIPLGVKESLRNDMSKSEVLKKHSVNSPFILFVGTLQPRKNVRRLIEAFSIIQKDRKELSLVIIGKKGWMYEEILSAPQDFGVEEKVKFLQNIGDDELPAFYESAEVFVLPSLYEGFGLPILEAMKYDCPVITSNISSLPEAGGDAAVYFDPKSVEDIAEKITKVLSNHELRNKMVKEGHEQLKKFSWEKSAREVLKALTQVAK